MSGDLKPSKLIMDKHHCLVFRLVPALIEGSSHLPPYSGNDEWLAM